MTSSPNDLTSRLEADRRQIEETAAATARVSVLLRRAWLRPLVVGLSFFLGFSVQNLSG